MHGHTSTMPNNERCALLASVAAGGGTAGTPTGGGGGDEKEAASVWPYPLQHHLSSEVIRRTSVLWTPRSSSSSSSAFPSSSISIGWNRTNPTSRHTTPKELRSSFRIATPTTTTYTKDAQSEDQDGNDDDEDDEDDSARARTPRPPQSVSSKVHMITTTSVLNLVVATAGGIGMVTLPGSFAQVGFLAGGLLLLLSSLAASMSLVFLNYACTMVRFLQHQHHDAPPEQESTEDGTTTTNNNLSLIHI